MQFKTNCHDLGDDLLSYLNIIVNVSLLKNLGFQENFSENAAQNYMICEHNIIMFLFIEIWIY